MSTRLLLGGQKEVEIMTVWMLGKVIYITHGDPYKIEVITYKEVSRIIVGVFRGYFIIMVKHLVGTKGIYEM